MKFCLVHKIDTFVAINWLIELLDKRQLEARKWVSDSFDFINDISSTNHGLALGVTDRKKLELEVLSLRWQLDTDSFLFLVILAMSPRFTKRLVLSTLARLYDPLSWISPVV